MFTVCVTGEDTGVPQGVATARRGRARAVARWETLMLVERSSVAKRQRQSFSVPVDSWVRTGAGKRT